MLLEHTRSSWTRSKERLSTGRGAVQRLSRLERALRTRLPYVVMELADRACEHLSWIPWCVHYSTVALLNQMGLLQKSPSPPPVTSKPKGKRAMDSFLEEIKRYA